MRSEISDVGKKGGQERGSILFTAIMVIVVMLLMAIPFLVRMSAASRSTERGARALTAFNLAEAGIDRVVWELNKTTHEIGSEIDTIFAKDAAGNVILDAAGNRLFGPHAETVGEWTGHFQGTMAENLGVEPNTRVLLSTGRMPFTGGHTVDRTVRVVLEKDYKSIWNWGFFVDDHLDGMNNQFILDSYDSRDGPYDPNAPGSMGYMGMNTYYEDGSFSAKNGTVTGGLAAGGDLPAETPPRVPDPAIIDDVIDTKNMDVNKLVMDAPFDMPPVDVLDLFPRPWSDPNSIGNWFNPSFTDGTATPSSGDIATGFNKGVQTVTGDVTFTSANNGVYTSLTIADGSTLRISGDVTLYVTGLADGPDGDCILGPGNGADIVIEDGGSLNLILGKTSFYSGKHSNINMIDEQPGTPADCIILGTNGFMPEDYGSKIPGNIKDPAKQVPTGVFYVEQLLDVAGAIYMPRAEVAEGLGENHLQVWGAWLAYSMHLKTQTDFHYDEALGDIDEVEGGFPYWKIINWAEVVGGN